MATPSATAWPLARPAWSAWPPAFAISSEPQSSCGRGIACNRPLIGWSSRRVTSSFLLRERLGLRARKHQTAQRGANELTTNSMFFRLRIVDHLARRVRRLWTSYSVFWLGAVLV